ncbi:MAG TPA: choice-of-anchor tandem repeat GloVer-containing protein [Terriglobales bacterium]|nr:choice-of-anchor tandem repeat GloVer-containing protein [Terriglobales bacterium]
MAIASPAQTLTTLHNFTGQPNDGSIPYTKLVQGADGNFYGTTNHGGANNDGTIFKMTPGGTVTILHSFTAQGDGTQPGAGLIQASDGNFYGTTGGDSSGNCRAGDCGTVFKITPSGTLTTLATFNGQGGPEYPHDALIQASDGNFYVTSYAGGTNTAGTVFKITSSGTVTVLHSFNCAVEGCQPDAELIQATDGNFYGTTSNGTNGDGTVFKITPSGTLTTLHSFSGSDGRHLTGGLVQATDGNFYGTTNGGGANGNGTVFKITSSGTLTTLHSFDGTDGNLPGVTLIQAADGNFYGTTYNGGANGDGTIYKITPTGTLTTLYSFAGSDGNNPGAGLLQTADGSFYGTTTAGGSNGLGTVFKLQSPVTLIVSTAGDGTVTSTDGFINCPGTCQHTYQPGAQVTLDASAASGWSFSGWTGACSGVGPCAVTMTQNFAVTAVFIEPGHGIQFTNVTPCRLVDTRQSQPIQGGAAQSFTLPGLGGCNIPASARAYSLNVTVVPHGPLGFLTIWPTGEAQPYVSTMNSFDGRIKANAAIVPAGTNGAVTVYVSNTSDVILDIDGYFTTPGSNTLQFYPLTPCRVADTRVPSLPQGLGPPTFGANETRRLPVLTSSCLAGVRNAKTYSMNVTVIPNPPGPLGYLTVWPSDQQQPYVSTLNDFTGTVVANAAIVPAAANGDISVFVTNSTDVVVDINGYFAPPGQGGSSFYPTAPCRVYDSRDNNGPPFSGERTVPVAGSPCAPPENAQGYVFNATVVPANGPMWYLALWPDHNPPLPQPTVSTLNSFDGSVTSNMAIVPNLDGSVDSYAATLTQLILDIAGYFAP